MKLLKKSLDFLKKILITVILVILISSFCALEDQNKITPYQLNQILKIFAKERNLFYDEHTFWN